jgi:hypothetical protein
MKLCKLYRSRLILLLISIILLQTAIPPSLSAMDLMEAYTSAKKSDPLFGSYVISNDALRLLRFSDFIR